MQSITAPARWRPPIANGSRPAGGADPIPSALSRARAVGDVADRTARQVGAAAAAFALVAFGHNKSRVRYEQVILMFSTFAMGLPAAFVVAWLLTCSAKPPPAPVPWKFRVNPFSGLRFGVVAGAEPDRQVALVQRRGGFGEHRGAFGGHPAPVAVGVGSSRR